MLSAAATVPAYLKSLPDDRRPIITTLRTLIRKNLPAGYVEEMRWGMINYEIPLERYPETYNGQPMCYIGLASHKNHIALYLMSVSVDMEQAAWLTGEFEKAGKKLDMGKACIRFRTLDDLPLDAIEQVVASMPVATYIERVETLKQQQPPRKR